MKQGLVSILVLVFISIICVSCSDTSLKGDGGTISEDPVEEEPTGEEETGDNTSLSVSPETQTTNVGKTVTFKASLGEEDVTESAEWSSSNESVAKSEGNGKFEVKDVGSISISAAYKSKTSKATLEVERPEELDEGQKYSKLVWGIENCIGGPETHLKPCLGDCNDAYLVITGNDVVVTLGTYNDKIYITSDKTQDITFTTYSGSWNWPNHSEEECNPEKSVITIDIKDRFDKKVKSKSLKLHTRGHGMDGPYWDFVESTSINVKKGHAIDLVSHFEGTAFGANSKCLTNTSKLTRNKDVDAGYKLHEERSVKVNN